MKTPTVEPASPPATSSVTSAHARPHFFPDNKAPLRAELYGLESLEASARQLAASCQEKTAPRGGQPLLRRLEQNGRILSAVHRQVAQRAAHGEPLGPDAEWLLDNFYIVEEVLREVRHDLPRGYHEELPKLSTGVLVGYPRIYALALSLIAHTDSTLDEAHITRVVQAYQSVAPLTIGELWAVPTMLRLGLLENLRRLAEQMVANWEEYRRADAWIAPLTQTGGDPQQPLAIPQPDVRLSDAFIVRCLHTLKAQGLPEALQKLADYHKGRGVDPAEVVQRENQRQAVNQVSIGNCVTSLRVLGALNWGEFFERTSQVEAVLRDDPAGIYGRQDFATRDRNRRVIEQLAKRSRYTEVEVARRTVAVAAAADISDPYQRGRRNHIGYYLLGPGLPALKAQLGYRPRLRDRLLGGVLGHPNFVYFGSITALMAGGLALLGLLSANLMRAAVGTVEPGLLVLLLLAAVLPVSDLAVGLTNFVLTLLLPPRVLPKLEFKEGIPEECAAFVVMPSMLVRPQSGARLSEKLEIHYLANPDPQLRFALLTDFADASSETTPEDEQYVRAALEAIRALNERHAPDGSPRFFLFHRKRLWDASEGCWMGWERKRGKLEEFNRLLRGARDTSYTVCSSAIEELPHIRYVITLDADTQLPREAARRLIETLAHPLNRARFDPAQGRVVEGYAILQPRVSLNLPAANRSRFSRLWCTSAGVDPYSTAVSDTYQDLFGAGTFTGKGIYDVDAFEAATGNAFPDNHILSHDLIEANFARCGLVTDIELFDDFPSRYHAFARREHRWIRGDWQLLPWLGRCIPYKPDPRPDGNPSPQPPPRSGEGEEAANPSPQPPPRSGEGEEECSSSPPRFGERGSQRKNPLPALEQWKIVDNLRRSLVPPALVLWLVLSWTVLPIPFWLSNGLVLLVLGLPLFLLLIATAVHLVRGRSLAPVREMRYSVPSTFVQVLFTATMLLNQARLSVDAIVRTLARLTVTRRHLLEWETAASAERRLGTSLTHFGRDMWPATLTAALLGVLVALVRPEALPACCVFLLPWLLSPLLAYWISQPPKVHARPLTPEEGRELRAIARKTWAFFEHFVGAQDHWLPPDNFQEEPQPVVAHRTSPTNMGMYLLSTLAAHDLGYLGLSALVGRLEKTFETFEQLERFRGHFLNWYDTLTLRALPPAYVSTVDSGNLMGCLLTLQQGLLEQLRAPVLAPALQTGLADTLGLVRGALRDVRLPRRSEAPLAHSELAALLEVLEAELQRSLPDLPSWEQWVERLEGHAAPLVILASKLAELTANAASGVAFWAERFAAQVRGVRAEIDELVPWARLLTGPEADAGRTALTERDELGERWRALTAVPALADHDKYKKTLLGHLEVLAPLRNGDGQAANWLSAVRQAVEGWSGAPMAHRLQGLADRAEALALAMDFRFLYKADRNLFAVGYQVPLERLDPACYDLLASEARLASFLAIARGHAPRRHWFHLGRSLTRVGGRLCLLSWGGTMFEYLMPNLLMRLYPGTLLADSSCAAVLLQERYGRQRGVPWGISESAFSSQHVSFDYQYQAFGVPGLGLKRGLGQELVIAPYASALAVTVRPHDAVENFRRLKAEGAAGRYGFYESVDYTRTRLPEGRRALVVRCFMAHHQGMSLVALANCLLGEVMPRRFHAGQLVRATELLLEERLPRTAEPVVPPDLATVGRPSGQEGPSPVTRRITTPWTPGPRTHLLSNGHYSVMVTNAGSGFSRCQGLDVTRWREDFTRDDTGQFCYVRDLESGLLWSAGHQPVGRPAREYEVLYSTDKAEFRRVDGDIVTALEVTVPPRHNAEVRRVTLTNHGSTPRTLELTSYAEIVLAPHGADLAHPAFGKLFLETEWLPTHQALLCRRRPRTPEEQPIWAVHVAAVDGSSVGDVEFETDRERFLGRGRTPANPVALGPDSVLSGATGAVLDPIVSLRVRVVVPPGACASVAFCTAVAQSHDEALALADHYHDPQAALRALDLAWAHSQVELRHLSLSTEEAHLFQRLATHLIYSGRALRAAPGALAANTQGQSSLWRYGISGDRPILLASIGDVEEMPLARSLLAAHAYWRLKGLEVDLVLLTEEATGYFAERYQQLQEAARASDSRDLLNKPGGVFLLKADQLPHEDRILLQAAARVVLAGNRGSLAAQVGRLEPTLQLPEPLAARQRKLPARRRSNQAVSLPADLLFPNGLGGFTPDGHEYVLAVAPDRLPPAPWINVVANPAFGFLASESGLGATWAGNSQQNRLTPWSNDPVADPPSEVVYLRDETSGEVWTPTPRPLGAGTLVRHGQGYTVYRQERDGLVQELCAFVAVADPVKLIVLRLSNQGKRPRRLSATFWAEWVLGNARELSATHIRTEVDAETGALFARNPFSADYPGQVAFVDVSERPRTFTGDRTEFLGRNGSVLAPAALARVELSGRVGAGLDPGAGVQTEFELPPGAAKEIVFVLGAADASTARSLVNQYRDPAGARAAFEDMTERWQSMLTAVQVRTPDPALDVLVNRWLPYQVLSCRLWGRTAFYQSGGAYGFRDQLQDVMALVYGAPQEARAQLLRAAARQFVEGDVQHWWHPETGKGVRTRCSDDYLWLPFVACHYVAVTGDAAILDEVIPYLRAPLLKPGQDDDYSQPAQADETGSLYDHCVRALRHGLRYGVHGLPLMGSGDWNDGMNRVGLQGRGESVWLGWFLFACLRQFAELAEARGDAWAAACRSEAERLQRAIEESAWDGDWYRRAYFDDGTPLGSAANDECKIDSIAQSWAVLSGAAEPERARQAMNSVNEWLVRRQDGLILLFTPPFDNGPLQPGYIKGYVPGIRENGGQYTHAAAWVVQAFALQGCGQLAAELFDLVNPIRHTATAAGVAHYRVEPYVVAGDVYGAAPHTGRGGWTWYTGSAAWLFRVALESLLGFQLRGKRLTLAPCIPTGWPSFEITLRHHAATYHITVDNSAGTGQGVRALSADGRPCAGAVELSDDGTHEVRVVLGRSISGQ